MKKIIISFLAVLLIIGCSPAEDKKSIVVLPFEEIDVAKEEEAIKQVILDQLDAVIAASYEGEAAVWAQTPYIVRVDITGWDSVSVFYQGIFKTWNDEPEGSPSREFTASNFDIYVNGNFASVFHDEHFDYMVNGERMTGDSSPHKYLEKIDGEWKIITLF